MDTARRRTRLNRSRSLSTEKKKLFCEAGARHFLHFQSVDPDRFGPASRQLYDVKVRYGEGGMTEYDRLLMSEFFDCVTPLESEVLILMIRVLNKGRFDVFKNLEELIGEPVEPDTVKCAPDFDLIGLLRTYNFEEEEVLAWCRCVHRACEVQSDSALQAIQAALRLRFIN